MMIKYFFFLILSASALKFKLDGGNKPHFRQFRSELAQFLSKNSKNHEGKEWVMVPTLF